MRAPRFLAPAVLLGLLLAACSGEPSAPVAPLAVDREVAPGASAAAAPLDQQTLRQRASEALAANRVYAPAGDNAVEAYLALRELAPDDDAVETALVDLAPYVMIGAEQAVVAREFLEAERLVALLVRMDASAPALPRLRDALAAERRSADADAVAEAERQAVEARTSESASRGAATAAVPAPDPAPIQTVPATPAPAAPPIAATPMEATGAPATPVATPAASERPAPAAPPAAPPAAAPRELISRVTPRFPEAAERRRLEGEVELRVAIRPDGSVANVEVVRASVPGVFDREAVLAVRRWRYAPADEPSEARVVLQFRRS